MIERSWDPRGNIKGINARSRSYISTLTCGSPCTASSCTSSSMALVHRQVIISTPWSISTMRARCLMLPSGYPGFDTSAILRLNWLRKIELFFNISIMAGTWGGSDRRLATGSLLVPWREKVVAEVSRSYSCGTDQTCKGRVLSASLRMSLHSPIASADACLGMLEESSF